MKKIFLGAALLLAACEAHTAVTSPQLSVTNPPTSTGRILSASTQPHQNVGSMPLNMIASPDGKYVVTSDIGTYQSLYSISTSTGKAAFHVDFPNPAPRKKKPAPKAAEKAVDGAKAAEGGEDDLEVTASGTPRTNGLYYGLAISADGTLYAAQGGHDSVAILDLADDGTLTITGFVTCKPHDFPAGIALDKNHHLYVANNAAANGTTNDPFKLPGSVAIYDTNSKAELGRYTFDESYHGTSNFPFGITALADGSKAFVASERDNCVYVLDTHDPKNIVLAETLQTGAHPVAVLLSKDESQLYVANSLSDTISVVDTAKNKILSTVLLRPTMVRDLPGATPTAMALGADEDTLYVTLSDMNCVAVVDIDDAALRGYIPTGWYPSALALAADKKSLLVANAKGSSPRNPNTKIDPRDPKRKYTAALGILEGNVTRVALPSKTALADTTAEVLKNNRLDALATPQKNPLADISITNNKIKHVFYIIKENRTYDQILGDMKLGNGDPNIAIFGEKITPNQHALAARFVLLDNLYAAGEVSGDGWTWSTQGMADAYVSRNVPYSYSHRGRKFDFEGANNGYPAGGAPLKDDDGKPTATAPAFQNGMPPIPDVANTNRNIWDAAKEANLKLRNYGMFLFFNDKNSGAPGGPDNYPTATGLQPAGHNLAGVTDLDFRRFDLDYPDSDAPGFYFKQTNDPHCLYKKTAYGKFDSPSRFAEWNREFQMSLAKDPSGESVPNLTLIRFMTDHTSATAAFKHSPSAMIADNDYAIGQFVEAVSHSPIWSSSAIVIIEDDAQNGPDHVDSHRTTGYVISPYITRGSVDHHFYNTDSMLKTIELLLNMKPLCQFDAIADPVLDFSGAADNSEPYTAIMPAKDVISQLNPKAESLAAGDPMRKMIEASDKMDFTHADAAPAEEVNKIIWQSVKGASVPMPAPRSVLNEKDTDD